MAPARRTLAAVFAGDRRVWRAAACCAVPLLALLGYYLLRPVDYNTGSDNVEVYGYIAAAPAGAPTCLPQLAVPGGTARVRMQLQTPTELRPRLTLALDVAGRREHSELPPLRVTRADRVSVAVFALPRAPARPAAQPASMCITAAGPVSWGGTPLPAAPAPVAATVGGAPVAGRLAVWYLPPQGARSSYVSRIGKVLERAALFRPAPIGAWLYYALLFLVLPALALLAIRLLALAVAGRLPRRLLLWLYALALANFLCWALISPPFQAPDEVDHFAYTQSLVERGERPSRDAASPLNRWSSQEVLALESMAFFTDHQIGDTTVPWLASEQRSYDETAARLHPSAANGGGNETAASHGPVYYAALAPAYALASSSPLSQLTLMRIVSALIGALTVVFTYLLAREVAPGRAWPAVLAALLVAFQPMYAFISGAVNNDVGVNAGAAALELLMVMVLRRGITLRLGVLIGVVAALLPLVKETSLSLYPLLAIVLAIAIWRGHARADLRAWVAAGAAALAAWGVAALAFSGWSPAAPPAAPGAPAQAAVSTSVGASSISPALHNPAGFISYLWQVFLPKLPFMHAHFFAAQKPAYTIFVVRGWGAFGWYDVLFPDWVYKVILLAMLAAIPLGLWAARREWTWLRANALVVAVVLAIPVFVIVGFEAAYYVPGIRPAIGEFGRYTFPAIGPLAIFVVGALHAFGRRGAIYAGAAVLSALIGLGVAAQLLTLTTFYA